MTAELYASAVEAGSGWWDPLRAMGIPEGTCAFLEIEGKSDLVMEELPLGIPGFWQTPDMARSLVGEANSKGYTKKQRNMLVDSREIRYDNLMNRSVQPEIIVRIGEAGLYRNLAKPSVMRRQILRIIQEIRSLDVDFKLIPFDAPPEFTMSGAGSVFFSDDDKWGTAHLETNGGDMVFRYEPLVRRLDRGFERLDEEGIALSHKATVDRLFQIYMYWCEEEFDYSNMRALRAAVKERDELSYHINYDRGMWS